jgi:AraC-like DNA-binding protein
MKQMSCSGRFVRPFLMQLATYPSFEDKLEKIRALPSMDRVPIERAYETLTRWVDLAGDESLGLKAGSRMCLGAAGVLEFAMHSANSVRDSVTVATRYSRLFSDGFVPALEIDGPHAVIRLDHKLRAPRVIRDFTLSTWFQNHVRVQLADADEIEVWFSYDEPADLSPYAKTFGSSKLKFGARCDGFVFAVEHLDRQLASSDALLHAVHCEHLETLVAGLPDQPNLAIRVHQLVAGELRRGRPTAQGVARQLHMSQRTLVRRLEAEGTSFSAELDELRRQLALRFVSTPNLPLSEITNLLGFSHVQAFHRAFKRWTGQTPIQYRESQAHVAPPRH